MAQFEQWFSQDFTDDIIIRHRENVMFSGDDKGAIVGVRLFAGGTAYSGGGTVTGFVKRSDGGVVVVNGTLSGNSASIVMPSAALAYSGPIGVQIVLNGSGSTTTVLKVIYSVDDTTGTPIDPGSVMPSLQELIAAANAAIAAMEAKGQEVLDSIPSDYTALSELVNNLHESVVSSVDGLMLDDTITVYLSKLPIDRYGYRYSTSGYFAHASNTVKLSISKGCTFRFAGTNTGNLAVTLTYGTTKANIAQYITTERYYYAPADLYISFGQSVDISDITITVKRNKNHLEYPRYYYNDGKINPGTAQNNGTITYNDSGVNCVQRIPINEMDLHHDSVNYTVNGAAYDANDNYLGAVTKTTPRLLQYPYGTAYIMLTRTTDDIVYYDLKTATLKEKYYLPTIVDKPFNFTGANCIAFGDSISVGYYSQAEHKDKSFFTLFKTMSGANNVSIAGVGGAAYSATGTATQIITQVQNANLTTRDYIFIEAGTNDYGRGTALSQLNTDLDALSTYLNANMKTGCKVIVITPTNRTAAPDGPCPTLDEYRQEITNWALLQGYSVINGEEMGIPPFAGTYMSAVTADGLHPTEIGHQIMAKALVTILLS